MKAIFLFFIVLFNIALAESLNSLLEEYQRESEKSLQTVDEKLGHVYIYSQKEFRLMQYTKLSDILKEIPLTNLNKNKYGLYSLTLPGTKADVSGFFRFFINDHEISSIQTQSASLSWGDLPLDFIDYIEIYYGESSFSFGNETGVYFIRMYTKNASKHNGGELVSRLFTDGENSQGVTHAQTFQNGWAYFLFANQTTLKDHGDYENKRLNNDGLRRYLYLDLSNESTKINAGYTDIKKDTYIGESYDAVPDSGEIVSKDFYLDWTHYFLKDKSLKAQLSFDVNYQDYDESNSQSDGGLIVMPLIFKNPGPPKFYQTLEEDLKFSKLNAYFSKEFEVGSHAILTAVNASQKKYDVINRKVTDFSGVQTSIGHYYDFDEERITSILLQDNYKVNEALYLIGNAKFDNYQRSGYLKNTNEEMYRVGAIYTPYNNFGFKGFYTKTYLPPSFYNVDQVKYDKTNLEMQQYKFWTMEGVYTTSNSKFSVTYHNVKIDDFIYSSPVGFINVDHTIDTDGVIFNYEYLFANQNSLQLNYYTTTLSEQMNNSNKGGYAKYMGQYDKFEYFTSLLYRNSYEYLGTNVRSSFDLSLGTTYNFTRDLSFSIKGINVLDKSTKSLYSKGSVYHSNLENFTLEDYGRSLNLSVRWAF